MKLLFIQFLWSNCNILIGNLEFDGQLVFNITVEEFLIAWKADDTTALSSRVVPWVWTRLKQT